MAGGGPEIQRHTLDSSKRTPRVATRKKTPSPDKKKFASGCSAATTKENSDIPIHTDPGMLLRGVDVSLDHYQMKSVLLAHMQLQDAETKYEALSGMSGRVEVVSPEPTTYCWGPLEEDEEDEEGESAFCVADIAKSCTVQ